MNNILQKNHQDICRDILKINGNEKIKVEIDENSKSSLYLFFNDTIYISNRTNSKKSLDEQNKSKVLVIAHECSHAIQPKIVHIINFIISNIELVMFAVIILCSIFLKKYDYLVNVYTVISLLSILIRWYLEINATINSVKITSKYMLQNGANKDKVKELNLYYKKELLKSLPLFISYLFIFKIMRLIIVFII